ncbi:hypothetical protein B1A75_18005 [Geobacillus sp. LEMMY01]|nr:hypothetical protein B1A75_18005 [Geobacillus sp. LEMMY01]
MGNGFDSHEKVGRKPLFATSNPEQKAGSCFLTMRRSKIFTDRSSIWIADKGDELVFDVAIKDHQVNRCGT